MKAETKLVFVHSPNIFKTVQIIKTTFFSGWGAHVFVFGKIMH